MRPKIVHGSDASITDFPFQALLYVAGTDPAGSDGGGRFCGGVVRDATHVITAAHCVYDVFRANQVSDPSQVEVLAGTDDLTNTGSAKKVVASALSFDPQYDPTTNAHDVAIVTLPSDQPLYTGNPTQDGSSKIAPIDIMDSTAFDALTPGTALTVSGWGDTSPEPPDGSGTPVFSDHLKAAQVPLVDDNTCSTEYGNAGVPVDTSLLFCAGDGSNPNTIADSCQGDSGGPIVAGSAGSYVLTGLVDSGIGCAQQGFPGIYTRLTEPSVRAFADIQDPVQAPEQSAPTTISGGNQPGQTLTCNSPWSDGATVTYEFFETTGAALTSASTSGTTYTIQQSDLGSRILCLVKATNAGGYGFGISSSVLVSSPPPPVIPPVPNDTIPPKLRITSKSCTKTTCTVKVLVTDPAPSSGIARVTARLNYTRKVSCRKHGKRTTCTKRLHRTLKATGGTGGAFTIVARRLTPGTGYSVSLVPFDNAGNRPQFSTITNVRTKPRHRRGLR